MLDENGIYEKLTTKSHAMNIEAENYLPGGSSRAAAYFEPYPFFADKAEGHYIYDVDGNKFLDFMLNATTHILGHNHPAVGKAVEKQVKKGLSYGVPSESQIKLSKMICDRVESVDKIRFTNSGTEATLNAIRLARAFTGRHKIAKIEGGYHGTHEYVSVSVSHDITTEERNDFLGVPEWPGQPPSVLQDVLVFPYNNISAVENLIAKHGNELACIILEPVFSNIGYVPASHEFITKLREATAKTGILLIFDEVQSFRLSQGGAQQELGIVPDLTTFGKIIGGGTKEEMKGSNIRELMAGGTKLSDMEEEIRNLKLKKTRKGSSHTVRKRSETIRNALKTRLWLVALLGLVEGPRKVVPRSG